jgi:predicted RecA/RadA family phage recombinase
MTNKICNGKVFDVVLSGTVAAGEVVEMVDRVGVAVSGGVSGDTIAVEVEGVFEVAKTTAEAISQGQKVYWDRSTNKVTGNANPSASPGAVISMGSAYKAAGLNDTTVQVKLDLF